MEQPLTLCQFSCLVCNGKVDLSDLNSLGVHKICSSCRPKQNTDTHTQCLHCNSTVKVHKTSISINPVFFESKSRQSNPLDISTKASLALSLDSSSSPRSSAKPFYFSCKHSFCADCKENKLDGCFICKSSEFKFKCFECDSYPGLTRIGDYWRCKRNALHLTSICYACKTSNKIIEESNKCLTCNCAKSSVIICRRPGHQFCENCIEKMSLNPGDCYFCEHPDEHRCKRCGTYDIFCKNSLCPFCNLHEQHPVHCLYCLSDLKP